MRLLNKFGVVVLGLSVTGVAGAAAGYWSGSGPFGGTIYDVMVDPATPSVVYASTRGGLYRSDDAGSNWQRKDDGIAAGTSYGMVLATDPDLAGRLLAVDWTFRVFRSADRGDNWTFTGFVPPAGVSVVAVADVPGVAGSFYVLTSPVGVYKTTDNGSSFSEVVTGIPAGATASFIRTDHDTPNLVFVGISDFYGSTNPAATTWIWRSLDSGVTWSASYDTAGQPTYPTFVEDLSFGAGNTLYATANSQLIRSTDNGASWELRGSAGNVVKAHPTIADTVFVAKGYSGGAAGETFSMPVVRRAFSTATMAGPALCKPMPASQQSMCAPWRHCAILGDCLLATAMHSRHRQAFSAVPMPGLPGARRTMVCAPSTSVQSRSTRQPALH